MEFNATFLVSAISFIVFVFIMNSILYKPMQNIVDERQKFIDDTNSDAKNNYIESEKLLKDREEKLNDCRVKAKKVISVKTDEAKLKKSEIQTNAQRLAMQKVEQSKIDLIASKNDAKNVLSQNIENLAGEISSKILG